jgi:hypothetical protein
METVIAIIVGLCACTRTCANQPTYHVALAQSRLGLILILESSNSFIPGLHRLFIHSPGPQM